MKILDSFRTGALLLPNPHLFFTRVGWDGQPVQLLSFCVRWGLDKSRKVHDTIRHPASLFKPTEHLSFVSSWASLMSYTGSLEVMPKPWWSEIGRSRVVSGASMRTPARFLVPFPSSRRILFFEGASYCWLL